MGITHAKVSNKADGNDSSLIRPSDWNADHDVTSLAVEPATNTDKASSLIEEFSGLLANVVYPYGQLNYYCKYAALTDTANLNGGNYTGIDYNIQIIGAGKTGNCYTVHNNTLVSENTGDPSSTSLYLTNANVAIATATQGGGAGTEKGSLEALTAVSGLYTGATHWVNLIGAEFAVVAQTGTSVTKKAALAVTNLVGDAVKGSVVDAGLYFGNVNAGIGFDDAIYVESGVITSGGNILRSPNVTITLAGAISGTSLAASVIVATGLFVAPEIATPATPAAGNVFLYAKSDHKMYSLGSDGIERALS